MRWDKNFLTLIHLTLARRTTPADLRRRALRRHAADRRRLGARLRSRRHRRRRRPADDHRHQEQPDPRHPQGQRLPDGAAAHRRLQGRRAGEPAGAAAGGGHRRRPDRRRHGHRAARVLPVQVEKTLDALRDARRRQSARRRRRGGVRRRGARRSSTSSSAHGRAVRAERARAAAAGELPDFVPLVRGLGRRDARLPQAAGGFAGLPPEPRGGDQGARGRHRLRREASTRSRPCPTRYGARAGDGVHAARTADGAGDRVELPARTVLVAAGTRPNITYEKEHPGTLRARREGAVLPGLPRRCATAHGELALEPDAERLLHLVRRATAASSATTATTTRATPATS